MLFILATLLVAKLIKGGIQININYPEAPAQPEVTALSKEEQEYIDTYNQEQAEIMSSLQSVQQLFGMSTTKEDKE